MGTDTVGKCIFYTNDGYIDIYLLILKLNKHEFLLFVSDGSVNFHEMAFGWILSTPKRERLVAANGPSSGRWSQLRSEADGMLSASLFCAILREFFNNEIIKAHFVSDNNELVNCCTERQQYDHPWPNTTLEGEWDITEEIYNTHTNNKIEVTFGKFKGHCDRKERYEQKNQGKRIPLALQYPSCSAYFIIYNETITSNYHKQLINAYIEPMFMEYIQKKRMNRKIIQYMI